MSTAEDEEIVRKRLAAGTVQLRGDYPFRTLAKLCAAATCRACRVFSTLRYYTILYLCWCGAPRA